MVNWKTTTTDIIYKDYQNDPKNWDYMWALEPYNDCKTCH